LRFADVLIVSLFSGSILRWSIGRILFDSARKRAIIQARADQVARSELGGRANENAVGVLNQSIAPMKNFERREGVKPRFCCAEMRCQIANKALPCAIKPCGTRGNSFADFTEQSTWIVPQDHPGKLGDSALQSVQSIALGSFQEKDAIVQPLIQSVQQRTHAPLCALHVETVNLLARVEKLEAYSMLNSHFKAGHAFRDFMLGFGNQLRCRGRSWRSKIGGKIRNREISFVAYCTDYGQLRCCNGARHTLAVEGSQVFEGPSAARHNNDVDQARRVELG
jgi:hypothetical protein